MAEIIIEVEESTVQFVEGVPDTVTLTTNVPAMIFYTLDGTIPTNSSLLATGPISLPRESLVELRVIAHSPANVPEYSQLLTLTYSTSVAELDRTRRIGDVGLVLDDGDAYHEVVLGYGPDGYEESFSDVPEIELDLLIPETDDQGRPPGAFIVVGRIPSDETTSHEDNNQFYRETINNNPMYNPKAMYLDIDNTKPTELDIVGRPWGSMRDINKIWGGTERFSPDPKHISGDLVRSFYNPDNQIYAAYYFDTSDARWMVSKTKLDLNIPNAGAPARQKRPRVYKWMYHKRNALR
jgi:hypothetical protein